MSYYMREIRMNKKKFYQTFIDSISEGKKSFAILLDPDTFDNANAELFLKNIPPQTTHLFVGGSIVENGETNNTVLSLKKYSSLPIFLFPGDASQVSKEADVILFLSLLSGRNPEYLIGQQVEAISKLKNSSLEIISMGYILIDGGYESEVARVSNTSPMSQENVQAIVDTALAGEYLGAKLIYLEAGSGAKIPVNPIIVKAVKKEISVPLIIGGGIKTEVQKQQAYNAGADMVVMGTAFENN